MLSDFAFVPMDGKKWDKVLQKWRKLSEVKGKYNNKRVELLDDMISNNKYRDGNKDLRFLTRTDIDPITKKRKRVTTGITDLEITPNNIMVNSLVGNPLSNKNPRLKGALDSLERSVSIGIKKGKPISIVGNNSKLQKMYEDRFGANMK